jgi:hypothetical protein
VKSCYTVSKNFPFNLCFTRDRYINFVYGDVDLDKDVFICKFKCFTFSNTAVSYNSSSFNTSNMYL